MTNGLARLSDTDLRTLAAALRSGRLPLPVSATTLQHLVSGQLADGVASAIASLASTGLSAVQIATVYECVLRDRALRPQRDGFADIVTTGPDAGFAANRDTAVVVRELFANANATVLVAGYAVYQGRRVFQALADRMQQLPTLRVSMFLDIQRPAGDTSTASEIMKRFSERFRNQQWPRDRPLPELYYDPRPLDLAEQKTTSMHAKCVVVDGEKVFVSSANFTEAAHLRNIEIGMLVNSRAAANQITDFFTGLVADKWLLPIS